MAVSIHALTTYDTVKAELGLKNDMAQDAIERLINAMSEAVERMAGGRHFEYKTGEVELHPGFGDHRLILKRTPVATITQIRLLDLDGSEVSIYDPAGYTLENAEAGFVFRSGSILGTDFPNQRGGWPWTAQVGRGIRSELIAGSERAALEVTYDGGYITPQQEVDGVGTRTLPYDLEEAVISSVRREYRRRTRDGSIQSKSSDEVDVSFFSPSQMGDVGTSARILTPEAVAVVQSYWRGF